MARKKNEKKPKKISEAMGFVNLLSNEKVDFILGLIVLFISAYMVIAMVSYFSTGQADQSILEDLRPGEWLNGQHQFTNYCGSIGALLSYGLITINFGLSAFLIPVFLLLVSLWLMRAYRVNLLKWFLCLGIIMVWTSVALAKFLTPFAGNLVFNPGGNHGLFCVQFIENLIGPPGLTAVLAITAITFLTYLSTETIIFLRKVLNPIGYITSKVKLTVNQTPIQADEEEPIDEPNTEEESTEEPAPTVVNLSAEAPATEPTTPPTEEPAPNKEEPAPNKEEPAPNKEEETIEVKVPQNEEQSNSKTLSPEEILKTPIDPREPFTRYKFPTVSLLNCDKHGAMPEVDMNEITENKDKIVHVLKSFGVSVSNVSATIGPTVTLYEITPSEGMRIAKIKVLEDDIALSLSAQGIRIIAPIPGKGTIGIEVPNKRKHIVSMESVINVKKFKETKMQLPVALGKTITNEVFMVDLAKLPHLLVAGATGQGKSVGLNVIITSLLYKKHPNELKLVLIDPKKVEFSTYKEIAPHFMASLPENEDDAIITDVQKATRTLNSLCALMDHRYDLLKKAGVRKITEYNEKYLNHRLNPNDGHEYMPYIVVIIDEYGDLIVTVGKEVETPIMRIAQLARAVGIHMIIATQRPTTDIITGRIKANFPGRMAFRVMQQVDSRTILDRKGADRLIGMGDMLFFDGADPVRLQCAFVDTPEIEHICAYIADQPGPVAPMELPEPRNDNPNGGTAGDGKRPEDRDAMFYEVAQFVVANQQGSTSSIQTRFNIGFPRARRIMSELEEAGIVGPSQGAKPREVLIADMSQFNG